MFRQLLIILTFSLVIFSLNCYGYDSASRLTYFIKTKNGKELARVANIIQIDKNILTETTIYLGDNNYFIQRIIDNSPRIKSNNKNSKNIIKLLKKFFRLILKIIIYGKDIKWDMEIHFNKKNLNLKGAFFPSFYAIYDGKKIKGSKILDLINNYFSDIKINKLIYIVSNDKHSIFYRFMCNYRYCDIKKHIIEEEFIECEKIEGKIGINCDIWKNAEIFLNVQTKIFKNE